MKVNKVEFGGRPLIDISDTTVRPEDVLLGEVVYNAQGERITGTLVPGDMKKSEYGGSAPGVVAQADKAKEATNAKTANTLLDRVGGQGHVGDWYAPPGAVIPYAGTSLPNGWLWCGGNLVSRTQYPALFAAIGTTYGAGDGKTTFALPNLMGRVVAMRGNSQHVGDTVGADSKAIEKKHLPTGGVAIAFASDKNNAVDRNVYATPAWSKKYTINSNGIETGDGTNTPLDVRQSTIYLNYIIKT